MAHFVRQYLAGSGRGSPIDARPLVEGLERTGGVQMQYSRSDAKEWASSNCINLVA
jgi:hypothetical protein